MPADRALADAVRSALATAGDHRKAGPMQAYMKSAMPFRGVQAPEQKRIFRDLFDRHVLTDRTDWAATVRALWDEAGFREERYAAIALSGARAYSRFQTPASLPLYAHLVVTGAWWDFVDEVAIRRIGPVLRSHPAAIRPSMLSWSRSENLWKRRTAIICQVGAKAETDRELLEQCILPNIGDRDFFIRKGIGWALRAYAKIHPDWVRAWVDAHESELSGLSRREALKKSLARH